MGSTVRWCVFLLFLSSSTAEDNSFEGCLRKDSISCVQLHVYRKLRALFGQDTINLLGGFQLVRGEGSRSLEDNSVDEKMFGDSNVSERQSALEDYIYSRISNFFSERKFRWGLSPAVDQVTSTARMAVDSIPADFRDKFTTFMVEGRGKKKVIKSIVPILLLAKLKLLSLASVAYVVVALIAKKALVASTIALAITLYISVKKIIAKHHAPVYYEIHSEPSHHSSISHLSDRNSWAPAWSNSWDSYDPHSSASSHHLAYSPQKATLR